MPDIHDQYLKGVADLLGFLKREDPDFLTVLTLHGRLVQAIQDIRQYGPNSETRADLARVTTELNRICLEKLEPKQSFFELCQVNAPNSVTEVSRTGEKNFLSGAILYGKVQGFSALSRRDQENALNLMDQEIKKTMSALGQGCWLDFRIGDFVLFVERQRNELREDTLIKVFLYGIRLQGITVGQPFKIGVTIDWESNAQWRIVGPKAYLIGPSLHEAQLMMSFSDSAHFFISTDAHKGLSKSLLWTAQGNFTDLMKIIRDRFNGIWPSYTELSLSEDNYKYSCETFAFHDPDKRQHNLFNLSISDSQNQVRIGNGSIPRSQVTIEHREKRDVYPQQIFVRRLVDADEVSIIALTHEGTAKFLQEALRLRSQQGKGFWRKMLLVFPSQTIMDKIIDQHPSSPIRLARWESGKKSVFQFLLSQGPDYLDRWDCLEYDGNLPFVGNLFVGESNTSVRIAPILPGADMQQTFYMEIFEGMQAFTEVSNAFSVIANRSSRMVEWNIYGKKEGDDFHYIGLVNRKRLREKKDYCFPVVLIMLYAETDSGICSVLQERTIYNGSSDLATFSNISGRIIDWDVYLAKGLSPHVEYEDKDDFMTTQEFRDRAGLQREAVLPPETWEEAAIREIHEELGLKITGQRLTYHRSYYLPRDDGGLFFKIFSLQLQRKPGIDELQAISEARPHSNLSCFTLRQLKQYYRETKFNRLLQAKFEEIFMPIFKDLLIAEGND